MNFMDRINAALSKSGKSKAEDKKGFLAELQKASDDDEGDEVDEDQDEDAATSENDDDNADEEANEDDDANEDGEDGDDAKDKKATGTEKRYMAVLASPYAKGPRQKLALSLLGQNNMSARAIIGVLKTAPSGSKGSQKPTRQLGKKMAAERQPETPPLMRKGSRKAVGSQEDQAASALLSAIGKT